MDDCYTIYKIRPESSSYQGRSLNEPSAILFIPADGVNQAKAEGITDVIAVVPNKEYSAQGFKFQTVPAYNTNKTLYCIAY